MIGDVRPAEGEVRPGVICVMVSCFLWLRRTWYEIYDYDLPVLYVMYLVVLHSPASHDSIVPVVCMINMNLLTVHIKFSVHSI